MNVQWNLQIQELMVEDGERYCTGSCSYTLYYGCGLDYMEHITAFSAF